MDSRPRGLFSFSAWLRTGRLVTPDGSEFKSDPNHDPDTGRFTFADGGSGADGDGSPGDRNKDAAPRPSQRKVQRRVRGNGRVGKWEPYGGR